MADTDHLPSRHISWWVRREREARGKGRCEGGWKWGRKRGRYEGKAVYGGYVTGVRVGFRGRE